MVPQRKCRRGDDVISETVRADHLHRGDIVVDGGQRVVHRTQHVHGGIGVDTDYPVHRHLLWGKQLAATLGGASSDLARLGAQLAAGVEVVA